MSLLPIVPESLYDIINVEDPQFSPDGRVIAFVHMQADEELNGYERSIWFVPADGSHPAERFTTGAQDFSPRWSPDGSRLAFVSNRSGSPQLYVVAAGGGEAVQLSRMTSGVSSPCWSPDGRYLAFNARVTEAERGLEDAGILYDPALQNLTAGWSKTHREMLRDPREIKKLPYRTGTSFFDGQYQHVYVVPSSGGEPRRLSHGDFHHSSPQWTVDSKYVLANSNREQSSGDENFELWSSIIRFDIETAEETVMVFEVSEEGRGVEVSPDGKWLAHPFVPKVASPYAEPYYVAVSPLAEKTSCQVVSGEALTVIDFQWDADSEHLYFLTHDHGDGKIVRVSRTGSEVVPVVDGHSMVQQFSVSRDGRYLVYTASSPVHPSDLFVMETASRRVVQLTAFNQDFEKAHHLSEPQEIRYQGAGNVEIQGWFFRPRNFDPNQSYPLAVEIHGGPQVMWGNSFWHEFQMLCSRGYYVFFCNPRGSSGYGAEFQRIRGKGGYTDMADIMTGLDTVLSMEKCADPERLAVTGGSYGGYMTGWVVTHTNRFKAAVSQRGVYDELNMFGSGDIPESTEWYHNGVPREENLMELWEYSPAAHAKNVITPLLILHSEQDYRCPISQAESFFAHLRRNGNRTSVMVRFPREGHELSRSGEPRHRIERLSRIVGWFDQHIQHAGKEIKPLNAAEIQAALSILPRWEVKDGALLRSLDCGNFAVALGMVNRIAGVLQEKKQTARIVIDGSRVEVSLANSVLQAVTENEFFLARCLNNRVFVRKG
jgi:dipeptidyl aminopeptidase/acylaminoacyl peptidase/pterin-4a-carbinolamine dehydratase